MKNRIFLALSTILIFILGLVSVSAIDISVDNYYPTPVEAGDYVNVWLKVSNRGSNDVEKATIMLEQSYPFSLDPGEPTEIVIEKISAESFTIQKFKIKVDAAAVEGDNTLTFKYSDFAGSPWKSKSIPITVVESQTTFDVVLQEVTEEGIFIAVANIGKNPANAVTVRIPEQEDFKTNMVSASIVGNLESGDYTLVSFDISGKGVQKTLTDETKDNSKSGFDRSQMNFDDKKDLSVQIDYTDPLGLRQSVFKAISLSPTALNMASLSSDSLKSGKMGADGNSSSFFSGTWFWISIVLTVLLVWKFWKGRRKKR